MSGGYDLAQLEVLSGGKWSQEQLELIRCEIAPRASFAELALFVQVAASRGLDPFARQIYAIHRGGKMTIQTGIDGYRALAERTGSYAGNDDPVFEEEPNGYPRKATVTVHKLVGGTRVPFSASARMAEYKPDGASRMWAKMPHTMLGKCAEALALRKAFPAVLSGIYTADEMDQSQSSGRPLVSPVVIDVSPPQGSSDVTGQTDEEVVRWAKERAKERAQEIAKAMCPGNADAAQRFLACATPADYDAFAAEVEGGRWTPTPTPVSVSAGPDSSGDTLPPVVVGPAETPIVKKRRRRKKTIKA